MFSSRAVEPPDRGQHVEREVQELERRAADRARPRGSTATVGVGAVRRDRAPDLLLEVAHRFLELSVLFENFVEPPLELFRRGRAPRRDLAGLGAGSERERLARHDSIHRAFPASLRSSRARMSHGRHALPCRSSRGGARAPPPIRDQAERGGARGAPGRPRATGDRPAASGARRAWGARAAVEERRTRRAARRRVRAGEAQRARVAVGVGDCRSRACARRTAPAAARARPLEVGVDERRRRTRAPRRARGSRRAGGGDAGARTRLRAPRQTNGRARVNARAQNTTRAAMLPWCSTRSESEQRVVVESHGEVLADVHAPAHAEDQTSRGSSATADADRADARRAESRASSTRSRSPYSCCQNARSSGTRRPASPISSAPEQARAEARGGALERLRVDVEGERARAVLASSPPRRGAASRCPRSAGARRRRTRAS